MGIPLLMTIRWRTKHRDSQACRHPICLLLHNTHSSFPCRAWSSPRFPQGQQQLHCRLHCHTLCCVSRDYALKMFSPTAFSGKLNTGYSKTSCSTRINAKFDRHRPSDRSHGTESTTSSSFSAVIVSNLPQRPAATRCACCTRLYVLPK